MTAFIGKLVNKTLPSMSNATQRHLNNNMTSTIRNDSIAPGFYTPDGSVDRNCNVHEEEALIKFILFLISAIMLLMLSCCFKQRKSCKPSCCWGRPAPVVPLNMLDNYKNRHGYMLAFGVTVNSCVGVLLGEYEQIVGKSFAIKMASWPSYASVFVKMLLAILISVVAYPFFIAQNMRNRLFGSVLGFIYTLIYFGLLVDKQLIAKRKCWHIYEQENKKRTGLLNIFEDLPRLICLVALLLYFAVMFMKTIIQRYYSEKFSKQSYFFQDDEEDWKKSYMYIHVKHVFKKHILKKLKELENKEDLTFPQKVKMFFKSRLYEVKPGFQYSAKLMISTFISFLAVYLVVLNLCLLGYLVFIKLWNQLLNEETLASISGYIGLSLNLVKKHVDGLQACWWLAIITSLIVYIFVLMNTLSWYRRDVLMLRAGDRSFLPTSIKKGSLDPGTLITACFKFAGFQVGYTAWGYVINFLVHWLLASFLSLFLVVPLFYGGPSFLITLIKKYWTTVLITIIVIVLQGQFAKRCFLTSIESLSINNRRAFHVMSYIFFYFNIFIGIASCILRIVYSMILGLIFLPRLPKSTLPRSFERRDPGYLAYLGFLMVEHQHSNPVLQCFVRILLDHVNKDMTTDEYSTVISEQDGKILDFVLPLHKTGESSYETNRKIRARNRWHLFVMMIQNPSVIKYRSRYLKRRISIENLTKAMTTFKLFDMGNGSKEDDVDFGTSSFCSLEVKDNGIDKEEKQLERDDNEISKVGREVADNRLVTFI